MKDVKLGNDVVTSDGEKVGQVDRIIVHPETLEVSGIVVHEGMLFSTDRIIDEELIARVDEDGKVVLNVTEAEEEKLPELASARFVSANDSMMSRMAEMEYMTTPSAAGQVLVLSEPVDSSYAPAPDSPFQAAPATSPNIVDEDNLPEGTVTLEEGTDVVDLNGEKVGTVDDVIYDDSDQLEAIIVGEGLLFTHHVRVPASWIDTIGHKAIHLNRTAEDAESAGKID